MKLIAVFLSAFICINVALAEQATSELVLSRLNRASGLTVISTDLYWDHGSIGITLATESDELVHVFARNDSISPDKRTFTISLKPPSKGAPVIEENSAIEKRLIYLLNEHSKTDDRSYAIAQRLKTMLSNRLQPWSISGWYTDEFLLEKVQQHLNSLEKR